MRTGQRISSLSAGLELIEMETARDFELQLESYAEGVTSCRTWLQVRPSKEKPSIA